MTIILNGHETTQAIAIDIAHKPAAITKYWSYFDDKMINPCFLLG